MSTTALGFKVVEVYSDETIVVDGRTMPTVCLVEDDDGVCILLSISEIIRARTWVEAHSNGAAAIILLPENEEDPFWFCFAEDFIEKRIEHRLDETFEISEDLVYEAFHLLSYRDMRKHVHDEEEAPPKTNSGFVHLHAHTEMSALDGLTTVQELVDRAKADGQPAVAVTDHGVCAAHPDLQRIAVAAGIQPIFGIETYFCDSRLRRASPKPKDVTEEELEAWKLDSTEARHYYHLILWAMNDEGLRNLWAMSTEANRTGFYSHPRMDWDLLRTYNDGIMCSTACLRGPLAFEVTREREDRARHNMGQLLDIFGDRLYVELHTNSLEETKKANLQLVELAQEHGVPTIAVVDSHYPCGDDASTHKLWLKMQTNKDMHDDDQMFVGASDYHVMDRAEIESKLAYLGDAIVAESIANTVAVADRCKAEVRGNVTAPIYSKKGGTQRDVERVVEMCQEAWAKRIHPTPEHPQSEYMARFEREMRLLVNKSFCGYFLVVADYVQAAKREGIIVGPGRGSGSGSLVSYLLGITEIDPVKTGLLFERFLTEGRTALPDFDVDFPTSVRDWIQGYIAEKYGEHNVVRIGSQTRLKNRGVVQGVSRVLKDQTPQYNYMDFQAISAIIEAAESDTAGLGMKWDDLWTQHADSLEPYREKYPEIFALCDKLVGRLKTYGRHAAGWVISTDDPLTGRLPMRRGEEDSPDMITEYGFEVVEALGLIKFDLLTLRTLDTIMQAISLIKERTGDEIRIYEWEDEYHDAEIWDEICAGHTMGMFQIETRDGTRLTKQFQPRSLDDLADVITLVRPGPTRSGLTATYFKRRSGAQQVDYPDPRLREVLATTEGCFAAETRIVTKSGVREIGTLAGGRHELMTTKGGFLEAEVRSFGVQSLRKIALRRNQQEKIVYATSNHRWFAKWHDKSSAFREVLTDDLKPGMVLQPQMPFRGKPSVPSAFGVAAGITFGDGARSQWQCNLDLHGDKNIQLLRFFSQSRVTMPGDQDRYSEPYVKVLDLPRSWKDHPSLDEGPSYLLGWMAGYFAADGCVDENGQAVLAASRREDAEFFRDAGHRCGVGTYGIRTRFEKVPLPDGRVVDREISYVGLVSSTLTPEFFLVEQHRERFEQSQDRRQRNDRVQWAVVSIEDTDRVEEVFCAVVPHTQAFVLEDNILTGNCIIYQEQLMTTCQLLAGYTLEEADEVRSILGKKKTDKIEKEGQRFLPACTKHGMDRAAAEVLWAQMAEFAKYSFNRSHAYAYAMLGYWTAWLKFRYPVEFLTAVLSTVSKDRIPDFIIEARRMGYSVLPPDINESGQGFKPTDTTIRYGLDGISGVGETALKGLLAGQPFTSFDDFLARRGDKVDMGVVKTLARVGCFDSLFPNRAALERRLEYETTGESGLCVHRVFGAVGSEASRVCGFDWNEEPVEIGVSGRPKKRKPMPKKCTKACRQYTPPTAPDFVETIEPYTEEEIRTIEADLLGVWLSSTPFDRFEGIGFATGEDVIAGPAGEYKVAAIVRGFREHKDRNGKKMGFVNFFAKDANLDVTLFKDAWRKYHHLLEPNLVVGLAIEKQPSREGERLRLTLKTLIPVKGR